jgi:branched-chain amino acid transport system permease protein
MSRTGSARRRATLLDWSVPLSILVAIPVMAADRHRHGTRPDQAFLQAPACRPDPRHLRPGHRAAGDHQVYLRRQPDPAERHPRRFRRGQYRQLDRPGPNIIYPWWRLVYFVFSPPSLRPCSPSCSSPPSAWWCAPAWPDRETVGLLGINIERRFTIVFGLAAVVAGVAGVMYTPILPPDYHMGMDFLVLSFVVVVVGGMGSLPGAVLAGFLLGILQFRIDERGQSHPPRHRPDHHLSGRRHHPAHAPRGLMGRKGVMED